MTTGSTRSLITESTSTRSALRGMRARLLLVVALGFCTFATTGVTVYAVRDVTNSQCPVTPEEAVDLEISVDHEGQTVYFCCSKCRRKFLEDPTAYEDAVVRVMGTDGDNTTGAQSYAGSDADAQGESEHDHGAGGHNHATDHGEPQGVGRAVRWLGKLHPMLVHFPIALLLLAAALELLSVARGTTYFGVTIRVLIIAAAITSIPSAALGWANAAFSAYPAREGWILLTHRWLGTAVAVLTVVTAFLSIRAHHPDSGRRITWYRTCVFACAVLVAVTGHFGASLVFGWNHLRW